MAHYREWLPTTRGKILAMCREWITALIAYASAWNVPQNVITELQTLFALAEAAFDAAKDSSERTAYISAKCKAAFRALVAKMRLIKRHYFLSPPLADADYALLGLKPRDKARSLVPPPIDQVLAEISRPGIHLLELHFRPAPEALLDQHRGDYGCRYYWGVMPPGGASVEAATGEKRELMNVPTSGALLPFSKFTRRKKERIDFAAGDSGKRVFFCVRYENAKGEAGPWGQIFSSIIP
ncbi:MAG: hypothetical protein LBK25_05765 [Treponema sp.]|nr:hypothetical protein [Treponema sp.]